MVLLNPELSKFQEELCHNRESSLNSDNDCEDMEGDAVVETTDDVAADDDVRDHREGDNVSFDDVENEYGNSPVKVELVVAISSRFVKLFIL